MGRVRTYVRAVPLIPLVLTAALIGSQAAGQELDAKSEQELTELGHTIDKAAKRAAPEQVIKRIAVEFGKPEGDVQSLRQKGLGFGEISILLALAKQTGMNPFDILLIRKPAEGWGKLARDFGLKNLGSVVESVRGMERRISQAAADRGGGPEEVGKPRKPEELEKGEKMERVERLEHPGRPGR